MLSIRWLLAIIIYMPLFLSSSLIYKTTEKSERNGKVKRSARQKKSLAMNCLWIPSINASVERIWDALIICNFILLIRDMRREKYHHRNPYIIKNRHKPDTRSTQAHSHNTHIQMGRQKSREKKSVCVVCVLEPMRMKSLCVDTHKRRMLSNMKRGYNSQTKIYTINEDIKINSTENQQQKWQYYNGKPGSQADSVRGKHKKAHVKKANNK